MARTLFFIEAAVLAALSLLFPIVAAQDAAAFLLPLAVSLVLPLAASLAIWPPRSVFRALRLAFSLPEPEPEDSASSVILVSLGVFSRASAGLGLFFWLAAVGARLPAAGDLRAWTMLGAYLSVYALVNAVLWRILAEISKAAEARPVRPPSGSSFAERYGLTPRESETAARIASGKSYKETAYELGISIRTVKVHMNRVYDKTGAGSNVGLVLLLRGKSPDTTKVQ